MVTCYVQLTSAHSTANTVKDPIAMVRETDTSRFQPNFTVIHCRCLQMAAWSLVSHRSSAQIRLLRRFLMKNYAKKVSSSVPYYPLCKPLWTCWTQLIHAGWLFWVWFPLWKTVSVIVYSWLFPVTNVATWKSVPNPLVCSYHAYMWCIT